MANTPYWGSKKIPDFIDITKSDLPVQSSYGIYIGIVKSIDTEFRNGRLYVFIPGFGNNPDSPKNWTPVTYASPFIGTTTGTPRDQSSSDFTVTGQTYGFTMIPPDVGSKVLCCFPGGQRQYGGYWFACINSNLSKNMIPAIGALPREQIDPSSVPENIIPLLDPEGVYPVGEFDESNQSAFVANWYEKNKRPLHIPQTLQFINQGLDMDNDRGALTSSMQRDAIGAVFGFNTPGRPVNDPANDPTIKNRIRTNTLTDAESDFYKVTSRLGGHSLVLDDGDFDGNSNLVRLRTAAGHQILMNDTEGFIYISTSSGNSWVELTRTGEMFIYNRGDIAVRSQGSIMFHADKNFMIDADKVFINGRSQLKMQSARLEASGIGTLSLYGRQTQIKASSLSLNSSGSTAISSQGRTIIGGSQIYLNSGGGGQTIVPPTQMTNYNYKDVIGTPLSMNNVAEFTPNRQGFVNFWKESDNFNLKSINWRVPSHEPYNRGYGSTGQVATSNSQSEPLTVKSNTRSFTAFGRQTDLDEYVQRYTSLGTAARQVIDQSKKAPDSEFIKQATPESGILSMTKESVQAYMAQIGYSESTGRYEISNRFGYQGKYQLGSAALQDLGFVKAGTPQTQEALSNPNNWIGGEGKPNNLREFLENPQLQDKAMYDYTKTNSERLKNLGLITDGTSPEVVSGLLSSAHLGGPGAVNTWIKGGLNKTDANGTTLSQYFQLGRYSQTKTLLVSQSLALK